MELVLWVLLGWAVLTALGVVSATAVCRSGHLEDVARGFAAPDAEPVTTAQRAA